MCHRIKRLLLLLCLMAALGATSCTGNGIPVKQNQPEITLPPAANQYVAPIGDAALEYAASETLYLPRHDHTRLMAVEAEVTESVARPRAESLMRALLAFEGNGTVSAIGGNVRLALYGANPVETSMDVATVNLAASALQLDRADFYLACQAIANTLTELPDIQYVNILVMDKQIGLDLASTLPMGSLDRELGSDVAAAYELALANRVDASEVASEKRLTSSVSLYLPLSDMDGVIAEERNIAFLSQDASDMTVRLLQEIANGSASSTRLPTLPLLADLLTSAPSVAYSSEAGGNVVRLDFAYNFQDMLDAQSVSTASCLASVCYTLGSYLPNVAAIQVSVAGESISSVALADQELSSETGLYRRSDFAGLLMDECTLYLASSDGSRLAATQRPIPYYRCANPRYLILELAKGPQAADSVQGLQAIMSEAALSDADLLGFSLNENTLLVNFSRSFFGIGSGFTERQDRILAYGLVNTLLCNDRIKRVGFFASGATIPPFTTAIEWSGVFYPNFGFAVQ